jgi:hypothetical protein
MSSLASTDQENMPTLRTNAWQKHSRAGGEPMIYRFTVFCQVFEQNLGGEAETDG